jgi:hypothetical protein
MLYAGWVELDDRSGGTAMAKDVRGRQASPNKSVTAKDSKKASETGPTVPAPKRPRRIIASANAIDFSVSPKWQKRLKEMDDYQRSTPFVLSRFTLD